MIPLLLNLLIAGLIFYLIWYLAGLFIKGTPHQVIGAILALIFLLYCIRALWFLGGGL